MFVTPYLLTYGTLRKGNNNWKTLLAGVADHIGTYRLAGFGLVGLQAVHTGNSEDSLVVDLFELVPDRDAKMEGTHDRWMAVWETNFGVDALEGQFFMESESYYTSILGLKHPDTEEEIYAKLYLGDLSGDISEMKAYYPTGDYNSAVKWIKYPYLELL